MSEVAKFFLLQLTLLAVVLILHTYIGLHIVRRALIFSDLVLDQLAALGLLVAIGIGLEPGGGGGYLFALAAVLAGASALTLLVPTNPRIPREGVIGILFALALAGTLLLGDKISGGGHLVQESMTGRMAWVNWPLVAVTSGVYLLLLLFHYIFRNRFLSLVGKETRPDSRIWDFLFFLTQGVITVLIVPVAGVLMAYALLMIPASVGALFSKRWGPAIAIGWTGGFLACIVGLCGSWFGNWPYGPSLVLAMGALFIGALFVRALLPRNRNEEATPC